MIETALAAIGVAATVLGPCFGAILWLFWRYLDSRFDAIEEKLGQFHRADVAAVEVQSLRDEIRSLGERVALLETSK
ncbi:hypothetical protein RAS1_14330 [Phycisphaerae bacterium RAS1]|nr:hypothetical protein RAS1_14330 [Phycisphaerae bacterium RAS1]